MALTPTPDLLDDYLRHLERDLHRAPSTVRGYRGDLERLVEQAIPLEHHALAEWVGTGEDGRPLAANTRNRRLVILRGFIAFLLEHGRLQNNENPTSTIRRARVPRNQEGALGVPELRRLLDQVLAATPSWRRTRNEVLLLTLFHVGLRVSEVRNLDVGQVDLDTRILRGALRKGGGYVDAPLTFEVADGLARWLRIRPATSSVALFVGGPNMDRLTVRAIQKQLQDLGKEAGLAVSVHPHALRHAHATALYRAGVDLRVIGQSLNHASIRTTQRYVHTDIETLRAALNKLPELRPTTKPCARAADSTTAAQDSGTIAADTKKS